MQEEEAHNSPEMTWDHLKHSTLRLLEVVDFPRCHNADIDWYMRMPMDPPLVCLNIEVLPELCKGEGVILEPTFTMIHSQVPH